ncbi:hypothetical protein CHLRE_10g430350v5 [Chlamydomonas reinhardtii]|uniref:Uncharacterized protein n=1 Tax=Chlamydomonas reinhardtii TaxID=3055 RepID=A0A2K3D9T9_CHLRE|nr:uncharacterized protein CHLRE_10g430350v5 [Chlamydomonas reinhardtii]PNW77297.1 hypothetical protein CHLRE_10g430350v5 [Chlamydomonas reinhardtii]
MPMLGSRLLGAPSTSAPARAPLAQHGRLLVACRATVRSSSPRSTGDWRSSWRTELEGGANGAAHHDHDHEEVDVHANGHSYSNGVSHSDSYSNGASYNGTSYATGISASWRNGSAAANGSSYAARAAQLVREQDEDEDHDFHRRAADWRTEHSPQGSRWGSEDDDAASSSANGHHHDQQEEEQQGEQEEGGGGFFTSAFKDALKDALARSPLFGSQYGGGSGDEESIPPQPTENEAVEATTGSSLFSNSFRSALKESLERQQTEMDVKYGYGSDDEYIATPYKSAGPARRELSPMEELLSSALSASQHTHRRLTLIKNEIDAALEREAKQIERLDFALKKCENDAAYYATLERMMREREREGK